MFLTVSFAHLLAVLWPERKWNSESDDCDGRGRKDDLQMSLMKSHCYSSTSTIWNLVLSAKRKCVWVLTETSVPEKFLN